MDYESIGKLFASGDWSTYFITGPNPDIMSDDKVTIGLPDLHDKASASIIIVDCILKQVKNSAKMILDRL